jgi:hypothetical protein
MTHFTEIFGVDKKALDAHGAFDISLISDLPLFIDPFLLFTSEREDYQALHRGIIRYLEFLRDKSVAGTVSAAGLERWFTFHEVKQNWLGFTILGNGGSGLGPEFARTLNASLAKVFVNFGEEEVTAGTHMEKLCLIRERVGRDNISDFTVNLIKQHLLEYTEKFAVAHIDASLRRKCGVEKAYFNYDTETWVPKEYDLPYYNGDFVLLTPKDMLTRDDTWINHKDLIEDFYLIPPAISDAALRESVEQYFRKMLPRKPGRADERKAAALTLQEFPQLIDYYIKVKEDNGVRATSIRKERVMQSEKWFVANARAAVEQLAAAKFYDEKPDYNSYDEAIKRAEYFKHCIENGDVYRVFYNPQGMPIAKEEHAQLLFTLVWYASVYDFNREVNNGRGPVDMKVSFGSFDKSIVEFKLASNTKLRHGLEKQIPIYEEANQTKQSVKVIICFTEQQQRNVAELLKELGIADRRDIIVIDARKDNKPSASKA